MTPYCYCFTFIHSSDDNYLGCWRDANITSVLSGNSRLDPSNTIERCITFCQESVGDFVYAGVKDGDTCLCGDKDSDYTLYGRVSDAECQSYCAGLNNESCGGFECIALFLGTVLMKVIFFPSYLIMRINLWAPLHKTYH